MFHLHGVCTFSTSLLVAALLGAEDRKGDNGITFRLRQTGFAAGPRMTPDGRFALKVEGLRAQVIDGVSGRTVGPALDHRPLRADSQITAYAFSGDGKLVAVGTGDPTGRLRSDTAGEVRVWEIATGKLLASINPAMGDIGYVNAVAFAADGKTILVDCHELSGK